ncbi:MAG: CBS domain-containing protein [Desulfobaccales bacterium]
MTSHGAVQGYNSQALIDGQHPVIVHGGAFGFLGHSLVPHWVVNPNSFVLVGIGGFFAGVAKVQDALEKMARINVNELPVVRQEAPNEIIGMIAKRDIISYYYERSLKWR